jgi:hypothetical protein
LVVVVVVPKAVVTPTTMRMLTNVAMQQQVLAQVVLVAVVPVLCLHRMALELRTVPRQVDLLLLELLLLVVVVVAASTAEQLVDPVSFTSHLQLPRSPSQQRQMALFTVPLTPWRLAQTTWHRETSTLD